MITPTSIQTKCASLEKGIYESFYFRGNHKTGQQAFWLKHNLLTYNKEPGVVLECTLILFDKKSEETFVYNHKEKITRDEFKKLITDSSWKRFRFDFKNGSHFALSEEKLSGQMFTPDGDVSWDLDLLPSGEVYYHFSNDWFYHSFFPKKKILTNDIDITFDGTINSPNFNMEGQFKGMNGHNWGTEHAHKYVYADCNQFDEDGAYFDGFSAKVELLGGLVKSPYLSSCSLKLQNEWYHFNDVMTSFRHRVTTLSVHQWQVEFENKSHSLKVKIDGEKEPWVTLTYDHPSKKQSRVNNTKFAKGVLILIEKSSGKIIKKLKSDYFELESLIP